MCSGSWTGGGSDMTADVGGQVLGLGSFSVKTLVPSKETKIVVLVTKTRGCVANCCKHPAEKLQKVHEEYL